MHQLDQASGELKELKIVSKFKALDRARKIAFKVGFFATISGVLLLLILGAMSEQSISLASIATVIAWASVQFGITILIVQFVLAEVEDSPTRALLEQASETIEIWIPKISNSGQIAIIFDEIDNSGHPSHDTIRNSFRILELTDSALIDLRSITQSAQMKSKTFVRSIDSLIRIHLLEKLAIEALSDKTHQTKIEKQRTHQIRRILEQLHHYYSGAQKIDHIEQTPREWQPAAIKIQAFFGWQI